MLPGSLLMAILNPITGKFYDRYGIKWLLIMGSCAVLMSALGSAYLNVSSSLWLISILFAIRLVGVACIMMPVVTWAMQGNSDEEKASQTAVLTSLRTISGAFGVAIFTAILTFVTKQNGLQQIASVKGIDIAFMGMAILALLQLLISIVAIKRSN